MQTLLLYTLLSTAFYYLGSRALITAMLWTRYPPKLAVFMDCSACTGFWYGVLLSLTLGRRYEFSVFNFASDDFVASIIVGLCMLVLTPIAAGVMQRGLDLLGVASLPSEVVPYAPELQISVDVGPSVDSARVSTDSAT